MKAWCLVILICASAWGTERSTCDSLFNQARRALITQRPGFGPLDPSHSPTLAGKIYDKALSTSYAVVKVAAYPAVAAIQKPLQILHAPIKAIRERNPHYLYLIPYEGLRADLPYAALYFGLAYAGINFFQSLLKDADVDDATTLNDVKAQVEKRELKAGEKIVLIESADRSTEDSTKSFIQSEYGNARTEVEVLHVASNEEFKNAVKGLQNRGDVKYMFWEVHGTPGTTEWAMTGVTDPHLHPSFALKEARDLKDVAHGIFAPDAQLVMLSCSSSAGPAGKEFVQACANSFDPPPAQAVASNHIVLATDSRREVAAIRADVKRLLNFRASNPGEFFKAYTLDIPLEGGFYYLLFNKNKEDPEKIYVFKTAKPVSKP